MKKWVTGGGWIGVGSYVENVNDHITDIQITLDGDDKSLCEMTRRIAVLLNIAAGVKTKDLEKYHDKGFNFPQLEFIC